MMLSVLDLNSDPLATVLRCCLWAINEKLLSLNISSIYSAEWEDFKGIQEWLSPKLEAPDKRWKKATNGKQREWRCLWFVYISFY